MSGTAIAAHDIYDPAIPISQPPARVTRRALLARQHQRQRRSQILATLRRLLVEDGLEGITVRRLAEQSGCAVQTIYNLVGPREEAIVDAISEYTNHVGLTGLPDLDDPHAVVKVISCWVKSIEAAPEFCRQVCLISLSPSRGIFYRYRDLQLQAIRGLLQRQQASGVLHQGANIGDLAEQLVLLASALCTEWADRPFPIPQLERRLTSGYVNLLAGALNPAVAPLRPV
jgi:AcrR family transcriptional regulator